MEYSSYLPDEILLEIASYLDRGPKNERQLTWARLSLVCRQWYDVAVPKLYEAPYLSGRAFDPFVRTICPSINSHIRPSPLSGLVRELDLSHIVHQSSKSTTAREPMPLPNKKTSKLIMFHQKGLLGRTKNSLEVFVAPQASFAINCWASLSKCTKLRVLDLGLVSESISFQSLNQTLRQLKKLQEIYLPRCSSRYDSHTESGQNIRWPPLLRHLSLSGSVAGQFLWDMLAQPDTFPPTLTSLSVLHCPNLDRHGLSSLLKNLGPRLTTVELRDLPMLNAGDLDNILSWLPNLTTLTVAIEFITKDFGSMPPDFAPEQWHNAHPLVDLTLAASRDYAGTRDDFTPEALLELMEQRWLGRLRYVSVEAGTRWHLLGHGQQLKDVLIELEEMDEESWDLKRWHYAGVKSELSYSSYYQTDEGQWSAPEVRMQQWGKWVPFDIPDRSD